MKAVISIGGKQYTVSEGEELLVDHLQLDVEGKESKKLSFDALMTIDGDKVAVGAPLVAGVKVAATVEDEEVKGDKIHVIRFKSKKRVMKINGHRQQYTRIKIGAIA